MDRPEHSDACATSARPCFACHIKGVTVGKPSDFPTKTYRRGAAAATRGTDNAWNRGIATDPLGRPIVKADGTQMGVKEYGEKRHLIAEQRRERAAIPRPA